MDDDEATILALLGNAFSAFDALPELHQADRKEFLFAIHAAQNIVLSRGAMRALANAGKPSHKPRK